MQKYKSQRFLIPEVTQSDKNQQLTRKKNIENSFENYFSVADSNQFNSSRRRVASCAYRY
jgi:hypothetical protein